MKKIITSLLIFSTTFQSYSQENWTYVGEPKFSNGNIIDGTRLNFLNDGTPLAAFTQSSYSAPHINGASVKYYNGTEWKQLGRSKIVDMNPNHTRIVVDANNHIYVGVHKGMYIEVFKFQNGDWERIGDELGNVYGSAYNEFDLKLNSTGTPYIIYNQLSPTISSPTCKMFNGTEWITIGEMDGRISTATSNANTLGFDENDIPYALVTNESKAHTLELFKFDSETNMWNKINNSTISYRNIYQAKLELINSSNIFIAATGKYNQSSKHRPLITHYNGANFSYIDSANVMAKVIHAPYAYDMKVHNGEIYHAYVNGNWENGQPADIRLERYNSTSNTWELLAENLPTTSNYLGGFITLGFSNNQPLIGIDEFITETGSYKGSVLSTGNISGTDNVSINVLTDDKTSIKVFPNPFTNNLHISGAESATINITDPKGAILFTQKLTTNHTTLYTEHWNAGVYFLTLINDSNTTYTTKIIK